MHILVGVLSMILITASNTYAAVGCTLTDPDRDIKRIFAESTGYKTEFITIEEKGGKGLADKVEAKLGDALDPVYESLDVPYAYYKVLKGKEVIGYVHGVNQKGMYGGMQLILATEIHGKVVDFYYQKISSPEAKRFRDEEFTQNFVGLTLMDFDDNDIPTGSLGEQIKDPSEKSRDDFLATIRGLKKNLILFNEFILSKKECSSCSKGGAR